jgi:ribonuclease T
MENHIEDPIESPSREAETYISVDIETSGPTPGQYSILSIGACTVLQPRRTFYVELKPASPAYIPSALEISGLSMQKLTDEGLEPTAALEQMEAWLQRELSGRKPIFVAFNAPFDWMFMAEYFERYLGRNPFGHNALDIKAFYMGLAGVTWAETSMKYISRFIGGRELRHNALQDAMDQADIFVQMLAEQQLRE